MATFNDTAEVLSSLLGDCCVKTNDSIPNWMDIQADLPDLTFEDPNYDSIDLLSVPLPAKQGPKNDTAVAHFDPYNTLSEDTNDALWEDIEISTSEDMKMKSKPPNWCGEYSTAGSRSFGYEGNTSEESSHQPFKALPMMRLPGSLDEENMKHYHHSYGHRTDHFSISDYHQHQGFGTKLTSKSATPPPNVFQKAPKKSQHFCKVANETVREDRETIYRFSTHSKDKREDPKESNFAYEDEHEEEDEDYCKQRQGPIKLIRSHTAPEYITHQVGDDNMIPFSMALQSQSHPKMNRYGIGNRTSPLYSLDTHPLLDTCSHVEEYSNFNDELLDDDQQNSPLTSLQQTSNIATNWPQPTLLKQRTAPEFDGENYLYVPIPKVSSVDTLGYPMPQRRRGVIQQQHPSHHGAYSVSAFHTQPNRIAMLPSRTGHIHNLSAIQPTQTVNLNMALSGTYSHKIERIHHIVKMNSGLTIQMLSKLYEEKFGEILPVDTQLLKELVQSSRLLLMSRKDTNAMVIFYSDQNIVDMLTDTFCRAQEYQQANHYGIDDGAITIAAFIKELQACLNADLSQVDVINFLKRNRGVELIEEDENNPFRNLLRLIPTGECTVLLGNLSLDTNETQIRELLNLINPNWAKLRIHIHRDNKHTHAYITFLSLNEAETAMTQIKRNKFYTPQIRVELESTAGQRSQRNEGKSLPSTRFLDMTSISQSLSQRVDVGPIRNVPVTSSMERKEKRREEIETNNEEKVWQNNSTTSQRSMKTYSNFDRITQNVYQVIRANGDRLLMSQIASKYKEMFEKSLEFDGNPKYFVKMERLLLLNCKNDLEDVMLYYAPQPAHKLVVSILKKHSKNPGSGMLVSEFREQLEKRMGLSLDDCDLTDFLLRWRFLSIHENANGTKSVVFTPHNGSTVFFGNLNELCNEEDIRNELETANSSWKYLPIRLKSGKGFSYAFVDFPTRNEARRAVELYDDKAVFKSTSVSADIEVVGQRKRPHDNTNIASSSPSTVGNNDSTNKKTTSSVNESDTEKHSSIDKKAFSRPKVTVYLGNLKNSVTKQQIIKSLVEIRPQWNTVSLRLNVRSGWSHAFIDFHNINEAKELIACWHNSPHPLTFTRLRCEISR